MKLIAIIIGSLLGLGMVAYAQTVSINMDQSVVNVIGNSISDKILSLQQQVNQEMGYLAEQQQRISDLNSQAQSDSAALNELEAINAQYSNYVTN